MAIIRAILGALILLIDWLTTPRGVKRTPERQTEINEQTNKLALYQYKACPFCVKVRRAMKRQSLTINTFDAKRDQASKKALLEGGGKLKVPCLKIEKPDGSVEWMYESNDIIQYLNGRFAN